MLLKPRRRRIGRLWLMNADEAKAAAPVEDAAISSMEADEAKAAAPVKDAAI